LDEDSAVISDMAALKIPEPEQQKYMDLLGRY